MTSGPRAFGALRRLARKCVEPIPVLNRTLLYSAGYRVLSRQQAVEYEQRAVGWNSARSAKRQEDAYDQVLTQMRDGQPRIDFSTAAEAVRSCGLVSPSFLDVGCGSGYYAEVIPALGGGALNYLGVDYSEAMIERARQRYPAKTFKVADATQLPFDDGSFDIVFNGVALMHILNYPAALSEMARVAKRFAIIHCVPVVESCETAYLSKYAYGAPVLEIIFNRQELERRIADLGMEIVSVLPSLDYDVFRVLGHHSKKLTYLCRCPPATRPNEAIGDSRV